jgi:hypothetical protein
MDSRFGNSIYWTLAAVTTIIHFTTLQHINQRLVFSVRYHLVCLPVSLFCVSISLFSYLLSLSLSAQSAIPLRQFFAN